MPPLAVVKIADGDRFRAIREGLNVRQQAAAFHIGVDVSRLCRFEKRLGYLTIEQRSRLEAYLQAEAAKRHKQLTKVVASLGQTAPRAAVTA
jgi:hypothetical protein